MPRNIIGYFLKNILIHSDGHLRQGTGSANLVTTPCRLKWICLSG